MYVLFQNWTCVSQTQNIMMGEHSAWVRRWIGGEGGTLPSIPRLIHEFHQGEFKERAWLSASQSRTVVMVVTVVRRRHAIATERGRRGNNARIWNKNGRAQSEKLQKENPISKSWLAERQAGNSEYWQSHFWISDSYPSPFPFNILYFTSHSLLSSPQGT